MKKHLVIHFNNGRGRMFVIAKTEATSFAGVLKAALKTPQLRGTCPSTVQAVGVGSCELLTPMGDKKKGGKR